jgi:CHAT domain-containing protein/tetratricopeptide (TPR) repeat protein
LLQAKDALAAGEALLLGPDVVKSDFAAAIVDFEKSRRLFAETGDVCEAAIAENWTAQLLTDVGRISESRERYANIIAEAEKRKFKILQPPAYYWLAISDYKQTRFSDSNRNLKTALQLAESDRNTFEVQHAAEDLTANYSDLGEIEMALVYASRMVSAQGTYFKPENNSLRDLGTLADLSFKLKFFSTSLSLSKEALGLAQEMSPTDSRVNAYLRRIVNAAKARDDLPAALKVANEAKQIAVDRGNNVENLQLMAESYISLADVKSRTSDCVAALADYDKALDLYRSLPELTVSSYQIHKGKLFCFQQLDRQREFSGELETVLDLSEQYRTTIREDDSRQAFFANEQDVFVAATEHALKEGDSRRAFEFVEKSRARSLLDFVESDKPIIEVEKSFASVAHPLTLLEIQARLPEQVQLVQYAVLPGRLLIWTISRTRFDLVERSITAAELDQKIQAYQSAVVGKAGVLDLKPAAQELYQLLIPTDLATDKQICLVPDKSLHQLSFASLVSPEGKYLLEDHALFTAPSSSILVLATENARLKERVTNESLLSIGNPDFDREENPNLADLGSAAAEATSIAEQYGKSVPMLDRAATRDAFLHNFVGVDVVHFAGHFVANRYSPGKSKLLFAGGEIRSAELGTYKLPRAKLVVLSACETGFERYDKSEGAIGIARTFLALGAPLVVASQWQVDSEPTKDLMIAFHRYRRQDHLSSAESLRRAQLNVLRNSQTQAPFYWAAFSLFGGYANY